MWRCVIIMSGVQFVMTSGTQMMEMLCVLNLDLEWVC